MASSAMSWNSTISVHKENRKGLLKIRLPDTENCGLADIMGTSQDFLQLYILQDMIMFSVSIHGFWQLVKFKSHQYSSRAWWEGHYWMQINVTRDKALTSDQIWRMKKGQIYILVSLSLLPLSLSPSSKMGCNQRIAWENNWHLWQGYDWWMYVYCILLIK